MDIRAAFGLIALLGVAGTTGCATLRPAAAFSDVERLVKARTPRSIHWNQGTPADREVDIVKRLHLPERGAKELPQHVARPLGALPLPERLAHAGQANDDVRS